MRDMLQAARTLDDLGLPGPYRALLTPSAYYEYHEAIVEGGYPAARQLREIMGGVHRCAVLRQRGAVFSSREGDFVVTVGGDLTVGSRRYTWTRGELIFDREVGQGVWPRIR